MLFHEFAYQRVPLIAPPEGNQPFDAFLPDGRSLEMNLDIRSQANGRLALEWPTPQRGADSYILSTTVARVFTTEEVTRVYSTGKFPAGGFGQQGYEGRYVRLAEYYNGGQKLWEFINALKQQ